MIEDVEARLRGTIDSLRIINLESRADRRREMEAELAQIGLAVQNGFGAFFKAVRPEAAGPFPSVGARGCFLSHLRVLEQAQAEGCKAILILEDDAAIVPELRMRFVEAIEELSNLDWVLAYLGYRIAPDRMPGPDSAVSATWRRVAAQTRLQTTHAMLVHHRAFAPLIGYLSDILERPPGHPDGGPMHVDGAYSRFRSSYPDMQTLITTQPYVLQRASASDITAPSWKERVPFIGQLRRLRNRLSG